MTSHGDSILGYDRAPRAVRPRRIARFQRMTRGGRNADGDGSRCGDATTAAETRSLIQPGIVYKTNDYELTKSSKQRRRATVNSDHTFMWIIMRITIRIIIWIIFTVYHVDYHTDYQTAYDGQWPGLLSHQSPPLASREGSPTPIIHQSRPSHARHHPHLSALAS